jgi:heme A synthase
LKELLYMTTRYFVLAAGVVYALAGACGLVFGDFPDGAVVNLAHLGLGVWGITAYTARPAARRYSRGLAVAAGILAILGLLPYAARTSLGLAPAFDAFWLHVMTVLVAAYFGWGRRRQTAAYERSLRRAA